MANASNDIASESRWRIWFEYSNFPKGEWVGKRVTEYEDGVCHSGSLCFFGNYHPETGEKYEKASDVCTKGYG